MNIQLLKRVLTHIEKDYKHFTMRWWSLNKKKGTIDFCPIPQKLSCGTVGCFAGFTIAEALGQEALERLSDDDMVNQSKLIPSLAQNLLGLNDQEVADLFYSAGRDHYAVLEGKVMGTKAYAKAVTGAIKQYILEHRGVQL